LVLSCIELGLDKTQEKVDVFSKHWHERTNPPTILYLLGHTPAQLRPNAPLAQVRLLGCPSALFDVHCSVGGWRAVQQRERPLICPPTKVVWQERHVNDLGPLGKGHA